MSTFVPRSGLLTDNQGRGNERRLRVEVGQTGFWTGRHFGSVFELDMANGEIVVTKLVSTVDFLLHFLTIDLIEGEIRAEVVFGGTEGGTFDTDVDIGARNAMSFTPSYTRNVNITTGGTLTGGTVVDLFLNKVSNASGHSSLTPSAGADYIGVAAGTSYLRVTATGAVRGILKSEWEEIPEGVL